MSEERIVRKIGDEFEVRGVKVRVVASKDSCDGCFLSFLGNCDKLMGVCLAEMREDKTDVMAVPVDGLREVCRVEFTGTNLNDLAALECVVGIDRDNEDHGWRVRYADESGRVRWASGVFALALMNDGTGRALPLEEGEAKENGD